MLRSGVLPGGIEGVLAHHTFLVRAPGDNLWWAERASTIVYAELPAANRLFSHASTAIASRSSAALTLSFNRRETIPAAPVRTGPPVTVPEGVHVEVEHGVLCARIDEPRHGPCAARRVVPGGLGRGRRDHRGGRAVNLSWRLRLPVAPPADDARRRWIVGRRGEGAVGRAARGLRHRRRRLRTRRGEERPRARAGLRRAVLPRRRAARRVRAVHRRAHRVGAQRGRRRPCSWPRCCGGPCARPCRSRATCRRASATRAPGRGGWRRSSPATRGRAGSPSRTRSSSSAASTARSSGTRSPRCTVPTVTSLLWLDARRPSRDRAHHRRRRARDGRGLVRGRARCVPRRAPRACAVSGPARAACRRGSRPRAPRARPRARRRRARCRPVSSTRARCALSRCIVASTIRNGSAALTTASERIHERAIGRLRWRSLNSSASLRCR